MRAPPLSEVTLSKTGSVKGRVNLKELHKENSLTTDN